MTDYTEILDADIDVDSALKSSTAQRWRDNPIAMIEGASSAPKLHLGALQRLVAGDTAKLNYGTLTGGSVTTAVRTFDIFQYGTLRASGSYGLGGAGTRLYRTRAGSNTFIFSTGIGTPYNFDFDVIPGDLFYIAVDGSADWTISNDGGDFWTLGGYVQGNSPAAP